MFGFFKWQDLFLTDELNWIDRVTSIQLAFFKKKKKKSFWLVCLYMFIYMTVKWRACLETCCLWMCEKKIGVLAKEVPGRGPLYQACLAFCYVWCNTCNVCGLCVRKCNKTTKKDAQIYVILYIRPHKLWQPSNMLNKYRLSSFTKLYQN